MDPKFCPHCKRPLDSEREQFIHCCFVCRRYGLLLGIWPDKKGEEMTLQFTNEQIARLFILCAEIAAVREELPAAPQGFDVHLERAKNLRASLGEHSAALAELAALLRFYSPTLSE